MADLLNDDYTERFIAPAKARRDALMAELGSFDTSYQNTLGDVTNASQTGLSTGQGIATALIAGLPALLGKAFGGTRGAAAGAIGGQAGSELYMKAAKEEQEAKAKRLLGIAADVKLRRDKKQAEYDKSEADLVRAEERGIQREDIKAQQNLAREDSQANQQALRALVGANSKTRESDTPVSEDVQEAWSQKFADINAKREAQGLPLIKTGSIETKFKLDQAKELFQFGESKKPLEGPASEQYRSALKEAQDTGKMPDSSKYPDLTRNDLMEVRRVIEQKDKSDRLDIAQDKREAEKTAGNLLAIPGTTATEKEKTKAVEARRTMDLIQGTGAKLEKSLAENGVESFGSLGAEQASLFSELVERLKQLRGQGANFTLMEKNLNVDQMTGVDLTSVLDRAQKAGLGRTPLETLQRFLARVENEAQMIETSNKFFSPGSKYSAETLGRVATVYGAETAKKLQLEAAKARNEKLKAMQGLK